MQAFLSHQVEREELESVLNSGALGRSRSHVQFLRYVCERYFAGEGAGVKEYNIAVDALGRSEDFDPAKDSFVRVEAHRIRKRLKHYYETEGLNHPVHLVLPSGKYVPEFVPAVAPEPARAEVDKEIAPLAADRRGLYAASILGLFALAAIFSWLIQRSPEKVAIAETFQPGGEIRILAGVHSAALNADGDRWMGDRFAQGGEVFARGAQQVLRTHRPELYRSGRRGNRFQYDIPLEHADYELRLHFAETEFGELNPAGGGETSRLFRVMANNTPLLETFDVIADAAGANLADIRVFRNIRPATDGKLHLAFVSQRAGAFVNAIELLPMKGGRTRPIRLLASRNAYEDADGKQWNPDTYVHGGQLVRRTEKVADPEDPGLYRGERFGHFTYSIPVAPGHYSVTLRFAETWFGPGAQGGAGSRLFDVLANNNILLKNFDPAAAAAGNLKSVIRTFEHLQPNAQGKLVLSFIPWRNYAMINAIEVIDEGAGF